MSNRLFGAMAFVVVVACNSMAADQPTRTEIGAKLRTLDDAALMDGLSKSKGTESEPFLTEIVRRGGKEWRDQVDRLRNDRIREAADPKNKDKPEFWFFRKELNTLTAIRRLDGDPDPLRILVAGKNKRSCTMDRLPDILVLLTNLDVKKTTVQFMEGGHYRSGRQERWRFEVVDAKGKSLPPRPHLMGMRGGLSTTGTLEYGESWATELSMRSFVDIPAPGTYKVRILYHDDIGIVDESDISGLILYASLPFELEVSAIEIRMTRNEDDAIAKAISELPKDGPVKLLIGSYHREVHDFIAADSSPGKLLALGIKSAPRLLDLALDDKAHPMQRAWSFALLASITDRNDPRKVPGILGAYEQRDSGWRVFGGSPGDLSGGFGFSTEEVKGGKIDPKTQSEFAKNWSEWKTKQYFKVEIGN